MSIANMYEVEAIGELLEQKGLLTKKEILSLATQLKQKAELTDLTQQPFTAQENAVIEQVMEVIERHGLSADHANAGMCR